MQVDDEEEVMEEDQLKQAFNADLLFALGFEKLVEFDEVINPLCYNEPKSK